MKLIDYQKKTHDALRAVVRSLLEDAQRKGLPGEHHFYITFQTTACKLPAWLLSRYPETMTIVIQKQYENLVVEGDCFAITLYFDNRPERLVVPFSAISVFTDPHASCSYRMEPEAAPETRAPKIGAAAGAPPSVPHTGEVIELDAFRK